MKFKTTKKEIMNGYSEVVKVGYCELQILLQNENPVAYTIRKEGWAADIYDISGVAIVTGYAPFGNINVSHTICQKYEIQASEIEYHEKKLLLPLLIKDFIREVLESK